MSQVIYRVPLWNTFSLIWPCSNAYTANHLQHPNTSVPRHPTSWTGSSSPSRKPLGPSSEGGTSETGLSKRGVTSACPKVFCMEFSYNQDHVGFLTTFYLKERNINIVIEVPLSFLGRSETSELCTCRIFFLDDIIFTSCAVTMMYHVISYIY